MNDPSQSAITKALCQAEQNKENACCCMAAALNSWMRAPLPQVLPAADSMGMQQLIAHHGYGHGYDWTGTCGLLGWLSGTVSIQFKHQHTPE